MKIVLLCIVTVCIWWADVAFGQRSILPPDYQWTGPPERAVVRVSTNLVLNQMYPVANGYEMDVSLRQTWTDHRILFDAINGEYLSLSPTDQINRLWIPDTFFTNAHDVRTSSSAASAGTIRLNKNSRRIQFTQRHLLKMQCPELSSKHHEREVTCHLKLASYSHGSNTIQYSWEEPKPIQERKGFADAVSDFKLVKITHTVEAPTAAPGEYSVLRVSMTFQGVQAAKTPWLTIRLYMIPVVLVLVSWIPFAINSQDIVVRALVHLTCLSTLILHWSIMEHSLPGSVGEDVFFTRCLGFIAVTFIQLIFFVWIRRGINIHKTRKLAHAHVVEKNVDVDIAAENESLIIVKKSTIPEPKMNTDLIIDLISLVMFALTFLVFLTFYFGTY